MSQRESADSNSGHAVTPLDDHQSLKEHDEKSTASGVQEAPVAPRSPAAGSQDRPYSVFTTREKWFLVALCGIAAMYRFASFSHFLYLTLN